MEVEHAGRLRWPFPQELNDDVVATFVEKSPEVLLEILELEFRKNFLRRISYNIGGPTK